VLLWWNSRKFPLALRAAGLLFVTLTVFATLGSGQHYLVDLVASLPFALTVQSVASCRTSKQRWGTAAAVGFGLTIAWLILVRHGVSFALLSPAIPWTLVLATVSITLSVRSWMSAEESSGQMEMEERTSIVVEEHAAVHEPASTDAH